MAISDNLMERFVTKISRQTGPVNIAALADLGSGSWNGIQGVGWSPAHIWYNEVITVTVSNGVIAVQHWPTTNGAHFDLFKIATCSICPSCYSKLKLV